MRTVIRAMAFTAALFSMNFAIAQAPAGATGQCKDGTYTTNATKSGACSGHKGVKEWYAESSATKTDTSKGNAEAKGGKASSTPAPEATPAPAPASTSAGSAKPAKTTTAKSSEPSGPPAAGGGNGKVWLNTESNVYHCQDSKYYGRTKQGKYMSEADAKAAGAHADHGKPCSK